jgi:hypothetical protein
MPFAAGGVDAGCAEQRERVRGPLGNGALEDS